MIYWKKHRRKLRSRKKGRVLMMQGMMMTILKGVGKMRRRRISLTRWMTRSLNLFSR